MSILARLNASLRYSGLIDQPDKSVRLPNGTFATSVNEEATVTITTAFQTLNQIVGAVPAGASGVAIIPATANVATNDLSYGIAGAVAAILSGGTNPLPWAIVSCASPTTQGLQMTGAGLASITATLLFF